MKLRMALLAGVVLAPTLAGAQTYNRIIAFGDSLSDNGNLFAVAGTPPTPYYAGRFSNGPVWVELLNGPMLTAGPTVLGVPPTPGLLPTTANLNFAFGGARTDALVGVPPGTQTQIGNYLALGGRFRSTDLVTLWAGANDIFQAFPGAAANPATAQTTMGTVATTAATNIGTQVAQIAGAGAGTVLVLNLPDLGGAPSFTAQGALASQLASFTTMTHNTAWNTAITAAAAANPNTNVIQVPVDRLFAAVIGNPAAFGFTNVTAQCLTTVACVTGTTATQAGYLFWDGVHPTAAGHVMLSRYTQEYLFAPTRAAAVGTTTDVGFMTRRQGMSDMIDRLSVAKPALDKNEFFVSIVGETGDRNATVSTGGFAGGTTIAAPFSGFRYSAGGIRFGGFRQIAPAWTVGLGLAATTGDATAGNVSFKPTTFSADLVARWQGGPTFVNLGLGAQVNHFGDIERKTTISALVNKGSATGAAGSAVVEAGYRIDFGTFGIVPKARLAYIVAQTHSFTETGIAAPIDFRARTVSGLAAGGEVRLEKSFDAVTAHALVGYEDFIASSAGSLGGRLVANTARPFSTRMADPVGAGLLLGAGLDASFGAWKAGATYRASIGAKSQATHRGHLTVSRQF